MVERHNLCLYKHPPQPAIWKQTEKRRPVAFYIKWGKCSPSAKLDKVSLGQGQTARPLPASLPLPHGAPDEIRD